MGGEVPDSNGGLVSQGAHVDAALDYANKLLGGFGVEPINSGKHWDRYYMDIAALYVNMGDTYDGTLLYDVERDSFYLTTWGDWYETAERQNRV